MIENLIRDFLAANPECLDPRHELDSGYSLFRLLQWMCPYGVMIGGTYRHFKGQYYKVLGLVRPANDWETLHVKYVQVNDIEHEATRPLYEFLDDVVRENYKGPRFVLVKTT